MTSLTVPGVLASLDPIADFVLAQAASAGLDRKATYNLRLAVDEMATNIIVHGYAEAGRQGDVTLHAELTEDDLAITLEDTGVPYDPHQRVLLKVEADFDKPLEERQIGGLGVYFAIRSASAFRYEYVDGRNRNTLVFRREPTPATI